MAARRSKRKPPDAIQMLIADHKQAQRLFREFEQTDRDDADDCRAIVELACMELGVHATLEEEIFYPAARSEVGKDDESLVDEAEVEHGSAKQLIARLGDLAPDDPYYRATFTVLAEYARHHIAEEQRKMFPKLRKTKLDLDALAADMRARKEELMGAVETPGQAEPTLAAEGEEEPGMDEVRAWQARSGARR